MPASIREIQDSGKLIILDDRSKWRISSLDSITTKMWMKFDKIEVGFDKLTNVSRTSTSVNARRA